MKNIFLVVLFAVFVFLPKIGFSQEMTVIRVVDFDSIGNKTMVFQGEKEGAIFSRTSGVQILNVYIYQKEVTFKIPGRKEIHHKMIFAKDDLFSKFLTYIRKNGDDIGVCHGNPSECIVFIY